jgi:hypothetical protein
MVQAAASFFPAFADEPALSGSAVKVPMTYSRPCAAALENGSALRPVAAVNPGS